MCVCLLRVLFPVLHGLTIKLTFRICYRLSAFYLNPKFAQLSVLFVCFGASKIHLCSHKHFLIKVLTRNNDICFKLFTYY